MNKMAYRALKMIKMEYWLAFMFFHRMKRIPLWLLAVCALVVPGYVAAADTTNTCTDWNGGQSGMRLDLPPSVSFPPGVTPDTNRPLFTSPTPYAIEYKCNTTLKARQAGITKLGDIAPLTNALQKAGMQLKLRIRDSSNGQDVIWDPTRAENISFGTAYTGDTGKRTVYITVELYLTKKPAASFYVIPPLTAFKMVPYYGTYSGFFLTTSATRIQYVPDCFVKTALTTNKVDFGPVMTSDVDSSLSLTRPFTVIASVNNDSGCNKGNLQDGYTVSTSEGTQTFHLELPLKVTFFVNSGGEVSDGKSVHLYKEGTSDKNGLQLKIYDYSHNAVSFNNDSPSLPDISPANKLGEFNGSSNTWKVSKQYTATLTSTGAPVLTGKYNAQVTVKVSYY
ncbi:fimbrial protein [Salmonella enterica]|nr:fimbrial protein [Salmonella enterica]